MFTEIVLEGGKPSNRLKGEDRHMICYTAPLITTLPKLLVAIFGFIPPPRSIPPTCAISFQLPHMGFNFPMFSTPLLVVLRGTTKDAERASKARSKHSTHSGHSMIKPVANSAA